MKRRGLSYIGRFLTLFCLTLIPFATALAASAIAPTTEATQNKQPEDPVEYLFVQHATKASIDKNADETSYTLILQDISPTVAYFADRPSRKAGSMSIQNYLKLWENNNPKSFNNDPPNAYFNAMETNTPTTGNVKNFSIELRNPQYDTKTNTLRYTAIPLVGTNIQNIKSTFKYITLFIDNVCLACW